MMTAAAQSSVQKSATGRIRRCLDSLLWLLLILVLLCLLCYGGIQYGGRRFLIATLRDLGCTEVRVDSLRIGLYSSELRNLVCRDTKGRPLQLDYAHVSYPFPLPPRFDEAVAQLDGLSAQLRETPSGWRIDGLPLPQSKQAEAIQISSLPLRALQLRDTAITLVSNHTGKQVLEIDGQLLRVSNDRLLVSTERLLLNGAAVNPWALDLIRTDAGWTAAIPELAGPAIDPLRVEDCELRIPAQMHGIWTFQCRLELQGHSLAPSQKSGDALALPETLRMTTKLEADIGQGPDGEPALQAATAALALDRGSATVQGIQVPVSAKAEFHLQRRGQDLDVSGDIRADVGPLDSTWIQTESPLAITAQIAALSASSAAWGEWLKTFPDAPLDPAVQLTFEAQTPTLRIPRLNVNVHGLKAELPLVWEGGSALRSPSKRSGSLSVAAARWGQEAIEIAPLHVQLQNKTLTSRGGAQLGGKGPNPLLDAKGSLSLNWDASQPFFDGSISLRSSRLDPLQNLIRRNSAADFPRPSSLSGSLAVHARLQHDGDNLVTKKASVDVENLRIQIDEPQVIFVEGLAGTIAVRDFFPFRTAPHQRLNFESALLGSLPFAGGSLVFQVEGPDRLFLERCRLNWCGGIVSGHALLFRPSSPDLDLTLFVSGVQLAELFKLQNLVEGRAEGTLYGQLPFRYANGRISFENGYLYSRPGVGGRLQLKDAEALLSGLPRDTPQINIVKKTLKDMDYEYIRLDIDTQETMSPLKLSVLGNAHDDPTLTPVKLNFNIESNINELLDMTRIMKRLNLNP